MHSAATLLSGLVLVACLVAGCSDPKQVNAAFNQTRVVWSVFDTGRPDGLRALPGFEQSLKVVWVPRTDAVRASDLIEVTASIGAVAVSRMGLLLLDDSAGTLTAVRPGALLPLTAYETGSLFVWQDKLFMVLFQEPPAVLPPASLAWWSSGQTRLAFYPVPSQVKDPARQVVAVDPPVSGSTVLTLAWKHPEGKGWAIDWTSLTLDSGLEAVTAGADVRPMKQPLPDLPPLKAKLAERVGNGVPVMGAVGPGPSLLFTKSGWVAVGRSGEGRARLYRLPELGIAGQYTGALSLTRGFAFTWETSLRGYSGAAGLVYVPFAVLAP